MSERKITIGIDLGTSKCCVGVVRNGKVEILENERGNKTTPSYVAFTDTKRLVGEDAKDQLTFNSANTLNGIKRIIGRDFEEPLVTEYWKNVPYEGTVNKNCICVKASYKGREVLLHPQQVTACLLQKMKKMVEATFQCTVEQAVISVPASFENSQRLATKEAAAIAGLKVLALINEPTAAALAYLQNKTREEKEVIVIIDFGGGKLDVSIVAVSKSEIEVLAVSGSQEIGGEFLDELMMHRVMEAIVAKFGEEFIPKKNLLAKLRVECETAKKTLSLLPKVSMRIDGVKGDEDFHIDISREKFHRVIIPKLRPVLIRCLDNAFQASGLDKHEISLALLVGGSSRIPVFKVWLKEYFDPSPIYQTVNLDEAVASGAALYAAFHGGDNGVHDITIKDILSNTFCMSREVNPNIQSLFSSSKVTIPSAHVMPYCSQSPFNEETKCQTFEIFEEISDRNIHHKLIGTLCLSDEFSRATTLIRDVTFTIDRCGIFDVAVVLNSPQTTFPTIVKDYAGKLKKEQLSRAVHREELFQRDELEDLNRVETYTCFEKLCYDIISEVKNPLYEEQFPELVESLSVCAAEGLVWVEDMPTSTDEVLHRREALEALHEEFSTKIEKLKTESLERTAAVSELSSLCSNIDVLLQTDGAWTEDLTTSLLMRTEIEQITQWLKLTKTPSLIDCNEKKNALQNMFERSVSRLVDNQQIINLRNYCLDLRETLPNNLDYEHCPQLRESLIGEVEDCLGWLDNTERAFKSECVKRMSSLKKNHCELVELDGTNSEAQEQKVGNPALLLRKICLQTRDLVKKCSKLGEMDPQKVENTKKQIMDFLCLVDGGEKASTEEWKDKISEVFVSKVMLESSLKKHEQMMLNEEERRATLQECQKSRSAMQSRIVNVFKPKICCRVMKAADKLVKWLETPNTFSKEEYQKRVEQWRTINERVNAELDERAKKDMEANSTAN